MARDAESVDIRRSLFDQLSHFADELRALRGQIHILPDEILTGRPLESDLSIKEIFALLTAYDEYVYLPAAAAAEGQVTSSEFVDRADLLERSGLLDLEIEEILRRGEAARLRLVAALEALTDWGRGLIVEGEMMDVPTFVLSIIQHDLTLLREAAQRLYDAGRIRSKE